ncbi:MAG: substrate-binding domain-containing protein [Pseudomonadota bacterium]
MRIKLQASFSIEGADGAVDVIDRSLHLLLEVERHGNLRVACERLGVSYRSGWDMIAALEKRVGAPVVEMTRGRGSVLTELGERLLWALKLVHARFDSLLDSVAVEIDAQVQSAITRGASYLKIFASHGYAIATINAHLRQAGAPVELSYRGSVEALHALHRKSCDVAGFPVPLGELQRPVFERIRHLLTDSQRLVTVTTRRLGLMVRKANPKNIWTVGDLARPGVRFVNRQQGSGTRMVFELLLERAGLGGSDIDGFETVELTHAAIAAYVASGEADAGLGVEAAARQFDLDFIPLLSERYFFVCEEAVLSDPRFLPVLAYLRGPEYRSRLLEHPGYEGQEAGRVSTCGEVLALSP